MGRIFWWPRPPACSASWRLSPPSSTFPGGYLTSRQDPHSVNPDPGILVNPDDAESEPREGYPEIGVILYLYLFIFCCDWEPTL